MTKQEFRKMWDWISNETIKQKRKVLEFEYFEYFGIPPEKCPPSFCYNWWRGEQNYIEASRLARVIANMPWEVCKKC